MHHSHRANDYSEYDDNPNNFTNQYVLYFRNDCSINCIVCDDFERTSKIKNKTKKASSNLDAFFYDNEIILLL